MMKIGKDFAILIIVVVLCCIKGIDCVNSCEKHIRIADPRHSSSENNDRIYVLSIDPSLNSTKCTWKFSTKSDFLLNLFFINYTSLAPAGSDCKSGYYMIRLFNSSTNSSFANGPYCGQQQKGIRVNGAITIELVAQRLQYVSGLSLAILVEASSKECGGLVTKPKGAVAVKYDAAKFGITKDRFAHCVWYFELSSPMDLRLIISQFTIYHDTYDKCDYYNDFLSIRSWNTTNSRERREILMCKKFNYNLPMVIDQPASDRFALIIHYERNYGAKGNIESIAFLASTGQLHSAVAVEGNGEIPYDEFFNSTDVTKERSTVTALKPYHNEFQIFGVIDRDKVDCRFIYLEIWLLESDVFQIKFNSCNSTSNRKFVTFNTQEMAILYVRAQKRHIGNLKTFYFSSKKECGGLFDIKNSQNISIVSPRTISGSYPPNMDCQWTVLAPQTLTLHVALAYMDMEDCSLSFYDYIELLQGFRTNLQRITKTCTNSIKDFNVTGDVTIRFVSDASQHRAGFTMIVTSTQDNNREMPSTTTYVPTTTTTNSKKQLLTSTASSISKSQSSSIGSRCCKTKGSQSKQHLPVTKSQKHTDKISKTSNKAITSATSEKLYAIGISFGALALLLLVITAVIHFKRRDVNSKAPYVISNELYQSSAYIDHERNDRNAKFEEIPMGNLYDYAQPKSSFHEVQENENTYDYPKALSLVPVDNDIVYERMDSQTYQCCPRNTPINEQYSYATSTHREESAFLESPQKSMNYADGKIRFGNGSIYDQPFGTDVAKTLMNDSSEADYSCASNDQYIAPDQLTHALVSLSSRKDLRKIVLLKKYLSFYYKDYPRSSQLSRDDGECHEMSEKVKKLDNRGSRIVNSLEASEK